MEGQELPGVNKAVNSAKKNAADVSPWKPTEAWKRDPLMNPMRDRRAHKYVGVRLTVQEAPVGGQSVGGAGPDQASGLILKPHMVGGVRSGSQERLGGGVCN